MEAILEDTRMNMGQLEEILVAHKKWMRGKIDGVRANLARSDLAGANLTGSNLVRANLAGANLARSDLAGANLYGANLYGANLYGANLYGADLARSDLVRADLIKANLYGANLFGADLARANLYGANLCKANLTGADLDGAKLAGAKLAGAKLQDGVTVIDLVARVIRVNDTHEFFAWRTDKGNYIKAGCRFMLIPEYRAHATSYRHNAEKYAETIAILDFLEARFAAKGGALED